MDATIVGQRLAPFIGLGAVQDPPKTLFVNECAAEAVDLIEHYIGPARGIPDSVLTRAALEVAADLYHRRTARNGIAGFDESEIGSSPMRINRDPLAPARPILAPFLGPAIA